MRIKFWLLPLFCLLFIFSCDKKDDVTSPIPKIALVSMGPGTVVEFKDSLLIVLEYQDGDGDLGGVHPDSSNLFVVDKRINVPFEFRIQELVPGGANVPIKGRFNVLIQNLFLTGPGPKESVNFDIYAIDKAGNKSNLITTDAIEVREG